MMWSFVYLLILFGIIETGIGLRCLSCKGTLEPWLCNIAKTCKLDENVCGLRHYRDKGGELRYDTFCTSDTICSNTNHNTSLCDSCCHGDICNARGCGSSGFPVNRGRICYNCNQVVDLSKCANLAFCKRGDVCAVYEERVFGRLFYTSKCSPPSSCLGESIIFGKRQSSQTLCGSTCCDSDFCNDHCSGASPNGNPTSSSIATQTGSYTEFVLMYPQFYRSQKLYILISAMSPANLEVDVPFISMKKTVSLTVGRNYLAFNNTLMMSNGGTGVEHKGIYLKSDVPLSVFGITDYITDTNDASTSRQYSEGFMVLPVSMLGTQYRVIQGYFYSYPQLISVAAVHDNTEVHVQFQISSNVKVSINGHQYHSGSTYKVTLNRLDTLCVRSSYITGTTIRSNKPVAMMGGNYNGGYYEPNVVFEPPVDILGTTFIVPPFPDTPLYYIRMYLSQDGDDAVVNVTNDQGTHQHRISYTDVNVDVAINSGPSFIESTRPLIVTVYTYSNSTLPSTLMWIPSTTHYKNNYTIANPNSVTPKDFDESALVVIPTSDINGLLVDDIQVHSNKVIPTLSVKSTQYSFLTISMDDPYQFIAHTDKAVKFGVFVFGKSHFKQYYSYSRFAFPADI